MDSVPRSTRAPGVREQLPPEVRERLLWPALPNVHASCLLMVSILTSLRLPMMGATIEPAFLQQFFSMQAQLLQCFAEFAGASMQNVSVVPHPTAKGKSLPAETPYSLLFRFFYFTQSDPVLGPSIRSLAAYVVGQCLHPPKKNPPALSADAKDDDNPPRSPP